MYVSITGLKTQGFLSWLRFWSLAIPAYRAAKAAKGAMFVDTRICRGTHHTLTVWDRKEDMLAYIKSPSHLKAMCAFSRIAGKRVQSVSVQLPIDVRQTTANGDTTVTHADELRAQLRAEVMADATADQSQACAPRLHQPLDGSHPWYVVHTKPRQELLALENLERQGYCCYLPQLKLKKPKARKLIVIDEPMFPRYLFIGADALFEKKGTSFIRSTKGVHELVRFGTEPAEIKFELLKGIFDREQAQHSSPSEPFQAGDCLRVVDGPLAGLDRIMRTPSLAVAIS